jgi:hypothetical protein
VNRKLTIQAADLVLSGAGDELFPLAARRIEKYVRDHGEVDAYVAELEFEKAVDDAHLEWGTTPDDNPAEKRAALVRLMSAGLARLAVDEIARGEDAIAEELGRLDPDGRITR